MAVKIQAKEEEVEEEFGEEPVEEEEPPAEEEEEQPAAEEEEEAEEAEPEGLEAKSGPELFKEVLRLLDTAEPEDYFKNGRWDDALMRMDVVLLDGHRREAGAPEPPDIKDVKLPANMPKAPTAFGQPGMFGVRPAGVIAPVSAAGGQSAELRLISLFVAKWQLDPTPTKTFLAKLTPPRRRYVIQSFKATEKGPGAADELKAYIAKCEKTNAWAAAEKAAALAAAARPAVTPQRPASAPPAWAGVPMRATIGQRPAVLGGVRPMGSYAARPMGQPRPGGFASPGAWARPASIIGQTVGGLKRPITSVSGPVSTAAAAVRQRIAAQAAGAGRLAPASFARPAAAVAPRPASPWGARAGYGNGAGAAGGVQRFAAAGTGYAAAQQGRATVRTVTPGVRPVTPGAFKSVAPGAFKSPPTGYNAARAGAFAPARPAAGGGGGGAPWARPGGGSFGGTAAARASSAPARPAATRPAGEKPGGLIRGLLQRL